ncbi:hypothetical protein THIX_60407 [Thiomonas sp. X19]|nr:hypothetical protein THIX_60407 [Thiomonas sp. X19]
MQTGVNNVHASIAQTACDDLDASVMAIEADFGKQHANLVRHEGIPFVCSRDILHSAFRLRYSRILVPCRIRPHSGLP